jgi:hypothetical protein
MESVCFPKRVCELLPGYTAPHPAVITLDFTSAVCQLRRPGFGPGTPYIAATFHPVSLASGELADNGTMSARKRI